MPLQMNKPRHPGAAPGPRLQDPRRVSSVELLQGADRLVIEHEGVSYLLVRTRQGKLLLTK